MMKILIADDSTGNSRCMNLGKSQGTSTRKQTATVFYYGRLLAFAIASTAMLFAGDATATEEIKIGGTGVALSTMRLLAKGFGQWAKAVVEGKSVHCTARAEINSERGRLVSSSMANEVMG